MNRAEQVGAQLVMLIRRQRDQESELENTKRKIDDLMLEVYGFDPGTLYQSTGEIPVISSAPVSPADAMTEVFTRPARADHLDGGSTFHFHPIGDTVTNLEVPMIACHLCDQTFPHAHGPDGKIHARVELQRELIRETEF